MNRNPTAKILAFKEALKRQRMTNPKKRKLPLQEFGSQPPKALKDAPLKSVSEAAISNDIQEQCLETRVQSTVDAQARTEVNKFAETKQLSEDKDQDKKERQTYGHKKIREIIVEDENMRKKTLEKFRLAKKTNSEIRTQRPQVTQCDHETFVSEDIPTDLMDMKTEDSSNKIRLSGPLGMGIFHKRRSSQLHFRNKKLLTKEVPADFDTDDHQPYNPYTVVTEKQKTDSKNLESLTATVQSPPFNKGHENESSCVPLKETIPWPTDLQYLQKVRQDFINTIISSEARKLVDEIIDEERQHHEQHSQLEYESTRQSVDFSFRALQRLNDLQKLLSPSCTLNLSITPKLHISETQYEKDKEVFEGGITPFQLSTPDTPHPHILDQNPCSKQSEIFQLPKPKSSVRKLQWNVIFELSHSS